MKKVKQSPRSDQPASCRSSKAAMRRSNVPRGHQEGAGKRRRQTRRRSRSRSDSAAAANARLSVLRAVPETGLRFVAQPRRHAGTGSRKGDSWTAERQSLFPPPGGRLNANDAPHPRPKRRPLSLLQAREDRSQITTLTAHAWRPPAGDRRELEEAAPFGAKRPTLWRSTFQPRATHRSARASPRLARDAPVGGPWRRRRAHCRSVRRAQYRDQSSKQKCPCFKLPKLERAAASGQTPMGIPSMAGLSPLV